VEFRILGAIEVIDTDGQSLALRGSRCRAMLAALALEPGALVSRESLIDRLWAAPPATAVHAVAVFASRLRRVLGRQRVSCHGAAYRLELDPDELDLARFGSSSARRESAWIPGIRARRLVCWRKVSPSGVERRSPA